MIKRIISCIASRIAVMEQVPTQLASVLPRAASYELELRTEEGNRSYTVNCHDKDGNTFRSYTMQTVEGQEEPLNFTYTDYTYDENGPTTPPRSIAAAMTTKTAFCARKTTRTANFQPPPRRFTPRLTTVSPLPSTRFTTQTATS